MKLKIFRDFWKLLSFNLGAYLKFKSFSWDVSMSHVCNGWKIVYEVPFIFYFWTVQRIYIPKTFISLCNEHETKNIKKTKKNQKKLSSLKAQTSIL